MGRVAGYFFFGLLDAGLATVVAAYAEDGSRLLFFMAVLGLLWLVPLLTGIWNLGKFWLAYVLFARRQMVRFYKAEMYRLKFPTANGYFDWQTYLDDLLRGRHVSVGARHKAAFFLGEIEGYRIARPFTLFLAAQAALQRAMDEYQAPPSTSGMLGEKPPSAAPVLE